MAKKLVEYLEPDEFTKILKAEKKREYKLCYLFGFMCGLRISEIVGLKKEMSNCCNDFILKVKSEINGKKTYKYVCSKCKKELLKSDLNRKSNEWLIKPLQPEQIDLKGGFLRVIGGKGQKDRIVPLFPNFKEEYIKLLPLDISRRTLQARFTRLGKKVLNKKVNFHMLRHSAITLLVSSGADIKHVQLMAGHSRLDTTAGYYHVKPADMIKKISEKWGEI